MMNFYDVVVIGAGHAGCEAAMASARIGAKTLLITLNMDHIAQMSCNPAIGGIAKGQVVREIDAMGGAMGIVTDSASIQFRMLNRTKGPAVWSPRSQCDKVCYQRGMKLWLEQMPQVDVLQSEVTAFLMDNGKITGVTNQFGDEIHCAAAVVTTGTFLNGKLHYGLRNFPGGRAGDFPSNSLSAALGEQLKLRLGRLKTGTPARILAKTIDFSQMARQECDSEEERFSCWSAGHSPALPEAVRHDLPCYQVYSTDETAEIVRRNLQYSPMYQGIIKGIGTRYCPSFEDKVVRFPQHPRHLLFLEPEGAQTEEYYINGLSTSLPPEVQRQLIHSVPGMEHAVLSRYAYAIEYDFVFPDQLERTLRIKSCDNLFTAGQINGTSGYEEAAGQGLLAGLNAARIAQGKSPVELGRDSSYIGVMIDDLTTKDIIEPYRLFTSRAEYRLVLRQDNADLRLSEFAYETGLLPESKYREFCAYRSALAEVLELCRSRRHAGKSLLVHLKDLPYDGYLQREAAEISRLRKLETLQIPADFDYDRIKGLSNESRSKLLKVRPTTLAQAGRIDGVTPADIALLQVALSRKNREATEK